MADVCVIYASEDKAVVERLVALLRADWTVWWDGDITHGDWERPARAEIAEAQAVLPVLSRRSDGKQRFLGELDFACEKARRIFPFLIEKATVPLSIGHYNRTEAIGWNGDETSRGFHELRRKIAKEIPSKKSPVGQLPRMRELRIGGKSLKLPCFMFSVSSHETQLSPKDGIALLHALTPEAGLVSAYDVWKHKNNRVFRNSIDQLKQTSCVLVLDSGNYEAFRKNDRVTRKNKDGWSRRKFHEVATMISPDIAFSFDTPDPKGGIEKVVKNVVTGFRADEHLIRKDGLSLCPIVHIPRIRNSKKIIGTARVAESAARIVASVAAELTPMAVAVPERELGNGIRERIKTVKAIRKALNKLGKYYPLHLLGTGNPISVVALAVAGADSFDGLEWCRTAVDYDNGRLFHFQHFDLFRDLYVGRLRLKTKAIINSPTVSYNGKVVAYNMDFFCNLMRTMQDMIHSGQEEHLLKILPDLGASIRGKGR